MFKGNLSGGRVDQQTQYMGSGHLGCDPLPRELPRVGSVFAQPYLSAQPRTSADLRCDASGGSAWEGVEWGWCKARASRHPQEMIFHVIVSSGSKRTVAAATAPVHSWRLDIWMRLCRASEGHGEVGDNSLTSKQGDSGRKEVVKKPRVIWEWGRVTCDLSRGQQLPLPFG